MDQKLKKYLDMYGVEYISHEHRAVYTVEESKDLKKEIPGLHCKCLFLKDSKGKFYLVGMSAEKRLDSKNFRKIIKAKKVRFGTVDELKEKVNLTPGSVSIFGAINIEDEKTKLIIDKQVWLAKTTGFHPNINTSTLELTHVNLEKFYNSLKCDKEIIEL